MKQEKNVATAIGKAIGTLMAWGIFILVVTLVYVYTIPTMLVMVLSLWGVIVPLNVMIRTWVSLYLIYLLVKPKK